jgi:uncharacterized protein
VIPRNDEFDVAALRRTGWRPTPFREFVLKMHGRCNLACDYCYVYEMADTTWRDKPIVISLDTVEQAARRIGRHAANHELPQVRVVLHGGEPLLAGAAAIAETAQILRAALPSGVGLDLRMQTNAVRLDEPVLEMLLAHDIRLSVSLDGDREAHDRHRRYADGRGSYDAVAAGLRLLTTERYRGLFAGLLCTIDLATDPVGAYEALLGFDPPAMDFLLPHGNWSAPPPGRAPDSPDAPYADWLIRVFERWYGASAQESRVRLFGEIITLLLGGNGGSESIGLSPVGFVVIDTDGSIEQVDTLKSTFNGAAATGLNVFDHSLDEALDLPELAARQLGLAALADECRACPIVRVCGGGYYPHRYLAGQGFRRPSVYCRDLQRLIRHIDGRLAADLTDRSRTR